MLGYFPAPAARDPRVPAQRLPEAAERELRELCRALGRYPAAGAASLPASTVERLLRLLHGRIITEAMRGAEDACGFGRFIKCLDEAAALYTRWAMERLGLPKPKGYLEALVPVPALMEALGCSP